MGKVVEKKTKKKKGRPSLLDLQKRRIQEQKEKHQRDNSVLKSTQNHNHDTPTPTRRSSRRNPAADSSSPEQAPGEDGYDEEISSDRGRQEKKLKLVLKLPNSSSAEQGGSDSAGEEKDDASQNQKKRKIAAIGYDGSGSAEIEKGENLSKSVSTDQGIQLDSKVSSLLPNKKLLHSVLDRIQKKDTYGVFSEPVDPEELPDYHEIIKRPMDFGTVRKKLDSGAYVKLEQFESDVFLICSNAMQYNAPETVYFRQARAIQELAKKSFENLRQDDEGNIAAPEPKRRGRPPTKNLKRPPLDPSASSDATLATTGGENAVFGNYDLRKAQLNIDKSGLANSSGRPRVNDVYANWVSQYRYDQNDGNAGSSSKGSPMKWGKKQAITDEDRRSTYNQFDSGHEPSVLATFSRERKQLMTVGLHSSDHGYGRSLARFAAELGPVAWKMASKMIEKSLPSGVEFGPGWVGENDLRLQPPPPDAKPSSIWPFPVPANSTLPEVDSRVIDSREEPPSNDLKQPKEEAEAEAAVEGSGLIHPGSNGFNNTSLSYNNFAAHHRPPSLSFHHHPNPSSNKEDYNNTFKLKREQHRSGSAPPDLNLNFNSPTLPAATARGESAQPDLALQL